MKLSATFINANGDTKPFDITEGFSLQDAFNVVANDDFAPTQINIQSENMNLPSYSLGSEQPVETAYDILGKYSTADIIAKHQISQQQLEPLLEEGANHELEHTSNILFAMKIAQDHLYEHLDYYKRLKQAKLAKGAVIEAVQNRNKYEDGGRSSFPIYTRMKNQIDKLSVMEFLRKYPQVESVMNQYVRTPNVKAGYLMFLSEKDMNDQNLEDWGATVKGTMTLPNGTKIKRYNWDFGNAEGFAEVFQYLYDKQNGYAKGGKVGADTSDKMVADAKGMSKQNYLNKYSVDITESYMDAKKQYEGHHKTDYPVTLGMFVDSLHTEYRALGGVTNTNFNNRYDKGGMIAPNGKPSNLSPQQYELVRTPEFKAWFGDWENDPKNASKIVDKNGEPLVVYHGTKYSQEFYEFDMDAISDENVKAFFFSKGYEHAKRYTFNTGSVKAFFLKAIKLFDPKSLSTSESRKIRSLLNESVVEDFIEYNYLDRLEEWKSQYDSNMSDEDFLFYILTQTDSSWQVVELEVMQDYLKSNNYNGFITYEQVTNQSTPNVNYAVFEPNQIKLADGTNTTFDGNNPDIRFDKGGYIDEQMFVDQNLKKIDDIYVIDKNGNQQDSLGDFTLQGFGKYMMRDLAKELYDEYKIRLRSDFALMIGEEVINPSIKVVQKTGNHINYLALIYNALVTEEGVVSYVYNEDGEEIGKFTDEDKAQEYVDAYDGVYVEARVEEITQPETILSMQFDFDTHKMKFVSSLLDKHSTHEFKYGGKL
jgi:hypothetical protein